MMVLSFVSLRLLSIFLFIFYAQGNSFPSSYDDWLEERGVDYDHFIFLGNSDNVAVHWRIEDDELLHLAVAVVNATGWVGFGIAENGGEKFLYSKKCLLSFMRSTRGGSY